MSHITGALFPKCLSRLRYFLLIAVIDGVFWMLVQWRRSSSTALTDTQLDIFMYGCAFLAIYSTFFVIVPRLRDAGWSPWLAVLGLVPFVWPFFHGILVFVAPKRDLAAQTI